MTLSDLNESGFKSTQNEIKRFNSLLAKQYKTALDQIRTDIRKVYDKVIGDRSPAQVAVLLKEEPAWLWVQANKFDRFQALQKKVQTQFVKASIAAGNMTVESSKMAISNNFYKQQFGVMFANASPVNLSFTVLNPAVVEISVLGTPSVWKKIGQDAADRIGKKFGDLSRYQPKHGTLTSTILNNRVKDLQKIQTSITQGLIQGKGFAQTAKDVKNVLDSTASQALRVVRTESMRNMNAGAFANHNQSVAQGLEMDRQILSVLDDRTRGQSVQVDTDIANEEGFFIYPGGLLVSFPGNSGVAAFDINDRETVIEIIDGQSPELRRGRNPLTGKKEVMSFKSSPAWMDSNGFTQNKRGRWVLK